LRIIVTHAQLAADGQIADGVHARGKSGIAHLLVGASWPGVPLHCLASQAGIIALTVYLNNQPQI